MQGLLSVFRGLSLWSLICAYLCTIYCVTAGATSAAKFTKKSFPSASLDDENQYTLANFGQCGKALIQTKCEAYAMQFCKPENDSEREKIYKIEQNGSNPDGCITRKPLSCITDPFIWNTHEPGSCIGDSCDTNFLIPCGVLAPAAQFAIPESPATNKNVWVIDLSSFPSASVWAASLFVLLLVLVVCVVNQKCKSSKRAAYAKVQMHEIVTDEDQVLNA